MNTIIKSSGAIVILSFTMLAACGGGVDSNMITPVQPTAAVLTLSTTVSGTILPSTVINSYDVTVILPAGVTARSTTNPPVTDSGVVSAAGSAAGSLVVSLYTAPTSTQTGTIKIHIFSPAGFSAGEFSVVNCDIAAGTDPKLLDFVPPTLDNATGFDSHSISNVLGLEKELLLTSTVVLR